MNLTEAKAECQRWLDYLDRQKQKSVAIQQIATDRRTGKCDEAEGRRRLKAIDNCSVTVYDGARLAEAVKFLMKLSESNEKEIKETRLQGSRVRQVPK